ncbi:MAG TPA: UvrD-helicase domain-containing protein, partial [Petrotogaceae bacterium]|nr:UvrD-helicase domain-containing protein [Petrotogaceae bacterium]
MRERIMSEVDKKLSLKENASFWRAVKINISRAWITTIDSFYSKILRENNIAIGVDPNFTIINEVKRDREIERASYNTLKVLFMIYENRNFLQELNLSEERSENIKGLTDELTAQKERFVEAVEFIFSDMGFSKLKESLEQAVLKWRVTLAHSDTVDQLELDSQDTPKYILASWLFKKTVLIAREFYLYYTSDQFTFDFKGIMEKVLQVFENEEILARYREKFKYIIVDEFQDTDDMQSSIFKLIHTTENHIFLVGDRKQSIYRFRGADLSVFAAMEKEFETKMAQDTKYIKQALSKNYRSDGQIVDFSNYMAQNILFCSDNDDEYSRQMIVVDNSLYNNILFKDQDLCAWEEKDGSGLKSDADIVPMLLEEDKKRVKIIVRTEREEEKNKKDVLKEKEIQTVAWTITKLLGQELSFRERDESTGKIISHIRPVKLSDITLLMTQLSGYEELIRQEFTQEKIPFYIVSGKSFYDRPEIQTVFSAISAVQNPHNDFEFAKYMMSFCAAMQIDELYRLLKYKNRKGSLFTAFSDNKDAFCDEQKKAFEVLKKYKDLKYFISPAALLKGMISELDYMAKVAGAQKDPRYAISNVKKLLSELEKYESMAQTYAELVKLLKKITDTDEAQASVEDEKSESVKVITIHKAKGLEFPITILAGLGEDAEKNNHNKGEYLDFSVMLDNKKRYFLLKSRFYDENIKIKTDKVKARYNSKDDHIKQFIRNDFLDSTEVKRRMYVAVTRPSEMLIPIVVKNEKDVTDKKYSGFFSSVDSKYADIISIDGSSFDFKKGLYAVQQDRQVVVNGLKSEINSLNLSDLTAMSYKQYIAPTYLINEIKKSEADADEENEEQSRKYQYDSDFNLNVFGMNENLEKGTRLHKLLQSVRSIGTLESLVKQG